MENSLAERALARSFPERFHPLLKELNEGDGVVLQILHNTRGSRIASAPGTLLKELLAEFKQAGLAFHQVAVSIGPLQTRELAEREPAGRWKTTWMGSGVSNWRSQLLFLEEAGGSVESVAEPREGENGDQPLPGCTEFRHTHFAPGYCCAVGPRRNTSTKCWWRPSVCCSVDQIPLQADQGFQRMPITDSDLCRSRIVCVSALSADSKSCTKVSSSL